MSGQSLADLPPVLSVKETARLLRLSRSAAYRRIEAGQIEAFKLGERWFGPTTPLERTGGLPGGAGLVDTARAGAGSSPPPTRPRASGASTAGMASPPRRPPNRRSA